MCVVLLLLSKGVVVREMVNMLFPGIMSVGMCSLLLLSSAIFRSVLKLAVYLSLSVFLVRVLRCVSSYSG